MCILFDFLGKNYLSKPYGFCFVGTSISPIAQLAKNSILRGYLNDDISKTTQGIALKFWILRFHITLFQKLDFCMRSCHTTKPTVLATAKAFL